MVGDFYRETNRYPPRESSIFDVSSATRRVDRSSRGKHVCKSIVVRSIAPNDHHGGCREPNDDNSFRVDRTASTTVLERGPPTSRLDSLFGKLALPPLVRLYASIRFTYDRSAKGTPGSTSAGYLSALPFTPTAVLNRPMGTLIDVVCTLSWFWLGKFSGVSEG